MGATISVLCNAKVNSWAPRIKLYESLIESVALYCAPIWSLRYLSQLETIHTRYFKKLLGLQRCTPNYIVRLETGTTKISVTVIKQTLKYILKILKMDNARYPRMCLERLLDLDNSPVNKSKYNWVSQINDILSSHNMSFKINQSTTASLLSLELTTIAMRLTEKIFHEDLRRAEISTYSSLFRNRSWEMKPCSYLESEMPYKYTKVLAQLRTASDERLVLSIGKVNYSLNCKDPCPICNHCVPESLLHIIFECPMYNCLRRHYIQIEVLEGEPSLDRLSIFDSLFVNTPINLSKFMIESLKLRSFITNE